MGRHNTGIEWTHIPGFKGETWNPVTGCSVVSPGCTHCYAMGLAGTRLKHLPAYAGLTDQSKAGPVWNGEIGKTTEKQFTAPLRWTKPRAVFVNSMGDLFHENVSDGWLRRVFAIMALCPQHVFMVLTKRANRMRDWVSDYNCDWHERPEIFADNFLDAMDRNCRWINEIDDMEWPLPNVWLGVSVEDQKRADERIPALLDTPAAKRFVSCEPLLGPVDLVRVNILAGCEAYKRHPYDPKLEYNTLTGHMRGPDDVGLPKLDWVIAGGESGSNARPMHPDWARGLRDQCKGAGVPFFFKQWGEWIEHGHHDEGPHVITMHDETARDEAIAEAKIASAVHPGFLSACGRFFQTWDDVSTDSARLMDRVGKRAAGHTLDGVKHHNFPIKSKI